MKKWCYLLCFITYNPLIGNTHQTVTITTETQHIEFDVETALTPEQQARGLMFRKYLRPKQGMLFLYQRPQMAKFWMKNTFIPLDLIFIDANSKVSQIHENAEPRSKKFIYSQRPIKAVLELFAGTVAHYQIKIDQVVTITENRRPHVELAIHR